MPLTPERSGLDLDAPRVQLAPELGQLAAELPQLPLDRAQGRLPLVLPRPHRRPVGDRLARLLPVRQRLTRAPAHLQVPAAAARLGGTPALAGQHLATRADGT